jgi:hypothetical protein
MLFVFNPCKVFCRLFDNCFLVLNTLDGEENVTGSKLVNKNIGGCCDLH